MIDNNDEDTGDRTGGARGAAPAGARAATDIEPRTAAVPVPARRPDPWVMAAVSRQRYYAAERIRNLEAENRELRAALEHELQMRTAEVEAAERRGRVAAEAAGQHQVLPGLLG